MRKSSLEASKIRRLFRELEGAMGPQHWWPAGSPFEVVVGAYLTQNTAWTNVERAMANLREERLVSIAGIRHTALGELERLLRPAGYFRQKAARLKGFVEHLDRSHGGSLEQMFAQPTDALREELLGLAGIGPETADSILLYAANREVFVVDSYTRRIFGRHGLAKVGAPYEEIRLAVQQAMTGAGLAGKPGSRQSRSEVDRPAATPPKPKSGAKTDLGRSRRISLRRPPPWNAVRLRSATNELHALLVQTAKHYCLKGEPRCESCPLRQLLEGKPIPLG